MTHFSDVFNLNKTQAELDFVDIPLESDIPLYIDPYALTTGNDEWSIESHGLVVSFFQTVLNAVANGNKKEGIHLLSKLGEPEETHLGVSGEGNTGRGIGALQASDVYEALSRSKAAQTGLMEDITDFALFIPGIGRDKISDITTNVIRKSLITYTQTQCHLHNINMQTVASGFYWDLDSTSWRQDYVELPLYLAEKLLLVPKHTVRFQVGVDHTRYRKMFVLEFLQEEHLNACDGLVTTLITKAGKVSKKVYKKTVDEYYPKDKGFIEEFSIAHPEVIDRYRDSLKDSASRIPDINEEGFKEADLASVLKEDLLNIDTGSADANKYHDYCIRVISFLFFPNLIYPKKEREINEGRKRIDITYTNGKRSGLFYRISLDQKLIGNTIHIECKNYTNEICNPEIDQLSGRYDNLRGRFGMLFFRNSDNLVRLKSRCKDVATQGNGVILPIDDSFIISCLELIENGHRKTIEAKIEELFQQIIS